MGRALGAPGSAGLQADPGPVPPAAQGRSWQGRRRQPPSVVRAPERTRLLAAGGSAPGFGNPGRTPGGWRRANHQRARQAPPRRVVPGGGGRSGSKTSSFRAPGAPLSPAHAHPSVPGHPEIAAPLGSPGTPGSPGTWQAPSLPAAQAAGSRALGGALDATRTPGTDAAESLRGRGLLQELLGAPRGSFPHSLGSPGSQPAAARGGKLQANRA